MSEDDDSPFLTVDETAELLRIKRRTLDNLRWSGEGPPARRHGGRIVYHRRDVLAWSEGRRPRSPPPGGAGKAPPRHCGDARRRRPGAPWTSLPILLWNASPSVPVGLYRLVARTPAAGELAVIRLPGPIRALAVERGYLAGRALVIKPVAAGPGDVVCRHAAMVTVNGHPVAWAHRADGSGRALPRWTGCLTLTASQVFVLSAAPGSFDSRYFGPVERVHVLGVGRPIWTREQRDAASAPLRSRASEAGRHLSLLEPLDRAVHLRQGIGELRPQ